jgi:hypothetical protein
VTDAERLQDVLHRESLSFLQYAAQSADPFATGGDRDTLRAIRDLAGEEDTALHGLADALHAARIPVPYLGAFPSSFANYNFIAVPALLRVLIDLTRRELAALTGVRDASPEGPTHTQITKLVDGKANRLRRLEEMVAPKG